MRLVRADDIAAVLDPATAAASVAAAVIEAGRADAERSRARVDLPNGGWLRLMVGTLPESDVFGYKAFHLIGGGDIRYLCALYRLSTGEPLALLDANQVTALRTGATAAAAARCFWGATPIRVGVIGSGAFAQGGLRSLAATCAVTEARVFSPRAARREKFAADLTAELGIPVEPVADSGAVAAGMDMLLCATQTRGSVAVRADDLGAVRYVSSISSTLPTQRELDGDVFAAVERLVIDTDDVLAESGDVLAAAADGRLDGLEVVPLWRFLDQGVGGGSRTLYKSIGSVEQDLGLALEAFRRCEARDIGQLVEPVEEPRFIG